MVVKEGRSAFKGIIEGRILRFSHIEDDIVTRDTLQPSAELPLSFRINSDGPIKLVCMDTKSGPIYTVDGLACQDETQVFFKKDFQVPAHGLELVANHMPPRATDAIIDLSCREDLDISLIIGKAADLTRSQHTIDGKAIAIYHYVHGIPHESLDPGFCMPYPSDYIIKHNVVKKCADKAQLFVDLARAVGIPARYLSGCYDLNPSNGVKSETRFGCHGWAVYFNGVDWLNADPTLGYFGRSFPKQRYFLANSTIFIDAKFKYSIDLQNSAWQRLVKLVKIT